ncbi:hypothetical protein SNEBB_003600 [Seison nebaliae]|nr:hypothetical protein SNEBB_003600 [Seison nebaliae]
MDRSSNLSANETRRTRKSASSNKSVSDDRKYIDRKQLTKSFQSNVTSAGHQTKSSSDDGNNSQTNYHPKLYDDEGKDVTPGEIYATDVELLDIGDRYRLAKDSYYSYQTLQTTDYNKNSSFFNYLDSNFSGEYSKNRNFRKFSNSSQKMDTIRSDTISQDLSILPNIDQLLAKQSMLKEVKSSQAKSNNDNIKLRETETFQIINVNSLQMNSLSNNYEIIKENNKQIKEKWKGRKIVLLQQIVGIYCQTEDLQLKSKGLQTEMVDKIAFETQINNHIMFDDYKAEEEKEREKEEKENQMIVEPEKKENEPKIDQEDDKTKSVSGDDSEKILLTKRDNNSSNLTDRSDRSVGEIEEKFLEKHSEKLIDTIQLTSSLLNESKYQNSLSLYNDEVSLLTDFSKYLHEVEEKENENDKSKKMKVKKEIESTEMIDSSGEIVKEKENEQETNETVIGTSIELVEDEILMVLSKDKLNEIKFELLWKYESENTSNQSISCFEFNTSNSDILAVGYGTLEHDDLFEGLICCWSLKTPDMERRSIRTDSKVTCLSFSKMNPGILTAGLFSGTVNIYNITERNMTLIFTTSDIEERHLNPVWGVKWLKNEENNEAESLMTISSDGRVIMASLTSNYESNTIMVLKRVLTSEDEKKKELISLPPIAGEGLIVRHSIGLCFDINPFDSQLYLVGTSTGYIHLCSISYTEQYLQTYTGHTTLVNNIKWSPHLPDIFLSCADDWTIRLWQKSSSTALMTLSLERISMRNLNWVQSNPMMFVGAGEKQVQIWNLAMNVLDPLFVLNLNYNACAAIVNEKMNAIYIATKFGCVKIYHINWINGGRMGDLDEFKKLIHKTKKNLDEQQKIMMESEQDEEKESESEDKSIKITAEEIAEMRASINWKEEIIS